MCALLLLSSVPHGEPCWSSSRTLGSQVWRSTRRQVQYSYVAQGQPLCWARCPCVVIPPWWSHMCILPRYGSPPLVSPCLPWQNPLPSLLCSYLTPGGLGLPQRLPYVVLPLASPYVWSPHDTSLCGMWLRSVSPYLGYAFPVLFYPLSGTAVRLSLLKPCPIFHPSWCGGTCRLLQSTGGGQQ